MLTPRHAYHQSAIPATPSIYYQLLFAIGVVTALSAPWSLVYLFSFPVQDVELSLPAVLLFLAATVGAILHLTRRDPFLRRLMLVALLAKMAAAGAYLYAAMELYSGIADALWYFDMGRAFVISGQDPRFELWGTTVIPVLAGTMMRFFGDSLVAITLVFASASFWGQYVYYRAFQVAFPTGDRHLAALLLFFFPSIVYWTATIGKDSVICVFLALAALGFAQLTKSWQVRGMVLMLLGLAGAMIVRPHIAFMIGSAAAAAYALGYSKTRNYGTLAKLGILLLLTAATVLLAAGAREFLRLDTIGQSFETADVFHGYLAEGGSAFGKGQSLFSRMAQAPFLLLRPFLWEAHNLPATAASLEGIAVALLLLARRRSLWNAFRSFFSNPFSCFILLYAIEFSLVLSGVIANFGTLARQRVMLLPLVIILCCGSGGPRLAPATNEGRLRRVTNAAGNLVTARHTNSRVPGPSALR